MRQSVQKMGDSLVVNIPKAFIEQHGLFDGSEIELYLTGQTMTIEAPQKRRYKLADLMSEMPNGLPKVEGWE